MDYQRLLQGILDIGEAMLMSGAENFRIDDSLYRICKSYGFVKYDVFVIPSNIQMERSLHRSVISNRQIRILTDWIISIICADMFARINRTTRNFGKNIWKL